MSNNSSVANTTSPIKVSVDFSALTSAQYGLYGVYIIIGVPMNLWFFVAILRSPEIRARLRNKLIAGLLLAHVVDTGLVLPLYLVLRLAFRGRRWSQERCVLLSMSRNMTTMQDLIANWTIVMILLVFLAQVKDINFSNRLTPLALKIVGFGLPAIPWLLSLLMIPIITSFHSIPKLFCILSSNSAMIIFKLIDCIIPLILAVILIAVAAYFRRRRYSAGSGSGVMKAELIGRGPEIDSVIPYVVIVTIALVFDVPNMTRFFGYAFQSWDARILFVYVTHFLVNARSVFLPPALLLFPDLRERIKTWRPWYRPGQGIDLTVGYRVEDA